jgi:hypothetical protein
MEKSPKAREKIIVALTMLSMGLDTTHRVWYRMGFDLEVESRKK